MSVPFVRGFKKPSAQQSLAAVGEFPWSMSGAQSEDERRRALPRSDVFKQPSFGGTADPDYAQHALEQLNDQSLFLQSFDESSAPGKKTKQTKKKRAKTSRLWQPLPNPVNDLDWLATVNESGQSFDSYRSFVSMRSGRFKPCHVPADRHAIMLLPIISGSSWPAHGPPLQELADMTRIYFDRPVEVLQPATVEIPNAKGSKGRKAKFKWKSHYAAPSKIQGRIATTANATAADGTHIGDDGDSSSAVCGEGDTRVQLHVDPLLTELSVIKEKLATSSSSGMLAPFCVMGVTMVDLYSGEDDLFVAGMAAGGSKVAVFSFHRYHPCMKMGPAIWSDFGYAKQPSDYSYFEDGKKRPRVSTIPPAVVPVTTTARSVTNSTISASKKSANKAEAKIARGMLLRSSKLLVHELMHLYGIDHCVFYNCIMRGTGHLVEDFSAPLHLCPVDLRKMQFRLGFDVVGRYEGLRGIYRKWGLKAEETWVGKRLEQLVFGGHGVDSAGGGGGDSGGSSSSSCVSGADVSDQIEDDVIDVEAMDEVEQQQTLEAKRRVRKHSGEGLLCDSPLGGSGNVVDVADSSDEEAEEVLPLRERLKKRMKMAKGVQ
jgi:archaemetzincin